MTSLARVAGPTLLKFPQVNRPQLTCKNLRLQAGASQSPILTRTRTTTTQQQHRKSVGGPTASTTPKGKMASSGEVWVQWFTCCLTQQRAGAARVKRQRQQHHQFQHPQQQQRLRIDRSMIGAPTNFQHTGHIGSGDLDMASAHLNAIQTQMQGKGGYEASFGVKAC